MHTSRHPVEPVFVTALAERPEHNVLRRVLNRLGKRIGFSKSVHPHRFRHTFAIRFLHDGGNLFEQLALPRLHNLSFDANIETEYGSERLFSRTPRQVSSWSIRSSVTLL